MPVYLLAKATLKIEYDNCPLELYEDMYRLKIGVRNMDYASITHYMSIVSERLKSVFAMFRHHGTRFSSDAIFYTFIYTIKLDYSIEFVESEILEITCSIIPEEYRKYITSLVTSCSLEDLRKSTQNVTKMEFMFRNFGEYLKV